MLAVFVALLSLLCLPLWTEAANTFPTPPNVDQWKIWESKKMPSHVTSGCINLSSPSGLTLPAFACTGFVNSSIGDQVAVIQAAQAVTVPSTAGAYLVGIHRDISSTVSGWTRIPGSHYLYRASSVLEQPLDGLTILRVTVSGGAITAVADLRVSAAMARNGIDDPTDPLYGAKGDGVTDDSGALQAAIFTGRSLDFGARTYKVTVKLLFTASTVVYRGNSATLLYAAAAPVTTRLADVTGSNVLFDGVNFNGGGLGVKGFLVYVGPNADRVRFHNLAIHNLLSHEWGTNPKNFVVGLGISPYGVTDFEVIGVTFKDIIKYNDGTTLVPASAAIVGIGNAHGIFFMNEDFSEPNAAQVTPTAGVIDSSTFTNIQTVLAGGLSENDRIEFDDGDGIRFYGCAPGGCVGSPTRLAVKMNNLTFRKVSKRAIKMSAARGQIATNITVYGEELPYGMVSIMKLDNDSFAANITGWASDAKPFIVALQMQGNYNTMVDGVYIEAAKSGVAINSGVPSAAVSHMWFSRINCISCSVTGLNISNGSSPSSQSDLYLLDSYFAAGASTTLRGIEIQTNGADGTGGLTVDGVTMLNADWKFTGTNTVLRNSKLRITSTGFAGSFTTRSLLEMTSLAVAENVEIDASGINTSYLSATRPYLTLFSGSNIRVNNFTLKVPTGLTTAYAHMEVLGSHNLFDGITYHGPGTLFIGHSGVGAAIRTVIRNAVRHGDTGSSNEFFYSDHASNTIVTYEGIQDHISPTASTIRINGGASTYVINNVASTSSNATIINHGGLAKTTNVQKFGDATFANLTAQQNGVTMWCRDCTKATPCASGGTGAYAKRMNGTWDCD